eukprot:8139822-Pyramimonas_sp.AAC.3
MDARGSTSLLTYRISSIGDVVGANVSALVTTAGAATAAGRGDIFEIRLWMRADRGQGGVLLGFGSTA